MLAEHQTLSEEFYMYYLILSSFHPLWKAGLVMPILLVKKLRLGKVKKL